MNFPRHLNNSLVNKLVLIFVFVLITATSGQAQDQQIVFRDVSIDYGIEASHRGKWNPESGGGYLAVGQAWADYNQDGWLDLYVTGNLDSNTLFVNKGDGSFSVSELNEQVNLKDAPSASGGATWADYDNDGWPDLFVVNFGENVLFHNDAGEGFTDVSVSAGVDDPAKGSSATWGDFDKDGFLDLYVVNWSCLPECLPEDINLNQDKLYHNNGDGRFRDVSGWLDRSKLLGAGFAASFFDADNDGDSDLYVVNDKMTNPIGNVLWLNEGEGCGGWCFTDSSKDSGLDSKMHAMGLAVGDYNNDNNLDLFATNMLSPMQLSENLGDSTFVDASESAGVMIIDTDRSAVGWGTSFFDADNDGFLDLYIATTGMKPSAPGFYGGSAPSMEDFHYPYPDLLYKNSGDGQFRVVTDSGLTERPTPAMGIAYADFNNDGWLDFVQGNWDSGYSLFENKSATLRQNNWLTIRLKGSGDINQDAVGARVYIDLSDGRQQMQEVINGQSLGSGNDLALHFGLGEAQITTLTVVWPNGHSQNFEDVPNNQLWELIYSNL